MALEDASRVINASPHRPNQTFPSPFTPLRAQQARTHGAYPQKHCPEHVALAARPGGGRRCTPFAHKSHPKLSAGCLSAINLPPCVCRPPPLSVFKRLSERDEGRGGGGEEKKKVTTKKRSRTCLLLRRQLRRRRQLFLLSFLVFERAEASFLSRVLSLLPD